MYNLPVSTLLYPELSYQIIGILFETHRELGQSFPEKYYQRAIEQKLKAKQIKFQKELVIDVTTTTGKVGKQIFDFLVDDKIILELKTVPIITPDHFRQVRAYLKIYNKELGILANFRGKSLFYQRILNRTDIPIIRNNSYTISD